MAKDRRAAPIELTIKDNCKIVLFRNTPGCLVTCLVRSYKAIRPVVRIRTWSTTALTWGWLRWESEPVCGHYGYLCESLIEYYFSVLFGTSLNATLTVILSIILSITFKRCSEGIQVTKTIRNRYITPSRWHNGELQHHRAYCSSNLPEWIFKVDLRIGSSSFRSNCARWRSRKTIAAGRSVCRAVEPKNR